MTARIREFLKQRSNDGPCLVVDLDVVRENYLNFANKRRRKLLFRKGARKRVLLALGIYTAVVAITG